MSKYEEMSEADLIEGIERTEKTISASRDYLTFLASGQGLPRNLLAREELMASHKKLIAAQERILEEIAAELRARR